MAADAEMVSLFKAELELCKVKPGEVVAVLSQGEVRGDYADAFPMAAQELGALAFHLGLPAKPPAGEERQTGKTPLANNHAAVEALKRAGLIVDLMGLLFSREQNEMTDAGARVLMVLEPIDVLRQMFPTEDQRRRVEYGAAMIQAAKEMHITSEAGTDIRYGLSQYPVLTEYGYTDTPGRWDHWPSGFLLTQGNDRDVDGNVVLMPGDIVNEFRTYVQSPVKLVIKKGAVTDIIGDGLDAAFLRSYIESFKDDRAYAVSHIGWGLNERAKWHHWQHTRNRGGEIGMNALAFYGNVLFSLGPNTEVGGDNDTACHLDMPLRNCNLYLDGKPVVEKGRIVPKEMQVAGM
jgi:2,5-dihydroxypyridine 5,6-dioxygenase